MLNFSRLAKQLASTPFSLRTIPLLNTFQVKNYSDHHHGPLGPLYENESKAEVIAEWKSTLETAQKTKTSDEKLNKLNQIYSGLMNKLLQSQEHNENLVHLSGEEEVLHKIIETIRIHEKVSPDAVILPSTHLMKDLGLDSLDLVEVL